MKTGTKILTAIGAAALLLGITAVILRICLGKKRRFFPVSRSSFDFTIV